MSTNYLDVLRFHQKLGLPVANRPTIIPEVELRDRIRFIREELAELEAATDRLYSGNDSALSRALFPTDLLPPFTDVFDALIDLVYVAIGTAIQLGLPWQQGWDMVQDANMQKERGEGADPHKLGVVKPEGWEPPDHIAFLIGYMDLIQRACDLPGVFTHGLRCEHGLHTVADICSECQDTAIMGNKPSTRGKK